MKEQALNWAQNETMVVYFTIEIRIFRTTPFFFIHPVDRISAKVSHDQRLGLLRRIKHLLPFNARTFLNLRSRLYAIVVLTVSCSQSATSILTRDRAWPISAHAEMTSYSVNYIQVSAKSAACSQVNSTCGMFRAWLRSLAFWKLYFYYGTKVFLYFYSFKVRIKES
jgi:hypothetical protein